MCWLCDIWMSGHLAAAVRPSWTVLFTFELLPLCLCSKVININRIPTPPPVCVRPPVLLSILLGTVVITSLTFFQCGTSKINILLDFKDYFAYYWELILSWESDWTSICSFCFRMAIDTDPCFSPWSRSTSCMASPHSCSKPGDVMYCTVLYCTVLYCTVPVVTGGMVILIAVIAVMVIWSYLTSYTASLSLSNVYFLSTKQTCRS